MRRLAGILIGCGREEAPRGDGPGAEGGGKPATEVAAVHLGHGSAGLAERELLEDSLYDPADKATMPAPSLAPIAPTRGVPLMLGGTSPAWIGSAPDAALQLFLPGVADRHVALTEREDGWWLTPGRGATKLNGMPLSGAQALTDGDEIEVAPGYRYRFTSGAEEPAAASAPAVPAAPRARRKKPKPLGRARGSRPIAPIAVAAVAILLVAAAAGAIWFGIFRAEKARGVLSDEQGMQVDSLMGVAYDHVERGNTLLELGLPDVAADEFARGVNTLALSSYRNHPAVKPRIEALEASVAAIYRDRKLTVPPKYAASRTTLRPDQLRQASLSAAQFAAAFGQVASGFEARFGTAIAVTGRDHAEHLSLYGPGGALDLRSRTMTPEEVAFVVSECRSRGIRVKDFSQDSVLQRQIAAATKAGLLDRAGTGLHLHIDRFANRRDTWTVSLHLQELEPAHIGDGDFVAVPEGVVLAAVERLVVDAGAVQARIDHKEAAIAPDDRAVVARDRRG